AAELRILRQAHLHLQLVLHPGKQWAGQFNLDVFAPFRRWVRVLYDQAGIGISRMGWLVPEQVCWHTRLGRSAGMEVIRCTQGGAVPASGKVDLACERWTIRMDLKVAIGNLRWHMQRK